MGSENSLCWIFSKTNPQNGCTKVAGELPWITDSLKYTIKNMYGENLEVCKKLRVSFNFQP